MKTYTMTQPIVKAHRILAAGLAVFILSHLAIHLTAMGGVHVHIAVLSKVQGVYRNPVIEPILYFAVIMQIGIGAKLVLRRVRQGVCGFWGRAQIISGGYLALFMIVHSSAALLTRYTTDLDTDFYWAAGTLNIAPIKYGFAPYYALGVLSLFVHLATAIYFGGGMRKTALPYGVIFAGLCAAILIVVTFAVGFYDINLPQAVIENFTR